MVQALSVACLAACLLGPALASEYLLPGDVIPHHYDLAFAFDLDPSDEFVYYGLAKLHINAVKPTSKIILHAEGFLIEDKKVSIEGSKDPITVTGLALNNTFNFLTINLDSSLEQNENYTLVIPFSGNLKNDLEGVYLSSYVDKTTKAKDYLIVTQFEATSARKGFPCFDEPMYKATFSINIAHDKAYSAVSNMPLFNSTDDNTMESYWPWSVMSREFNASKSSYIWDQFEVSVPMSTYLVAFVVSKFAYVESPHDLSTTKFRIWARSDAIDQTAYASTTGPKVLTYYEEWFNVSFPLPKQDMFAIPDFSAGAMENWGLITYRETALLYDSESSSFTNKEKVAEVIAHELAHQWFGNLVTMKWWSDLWLNEGFATYVASLGMRHVEPDWQSPLLNAVENLLIVLHSDSLESSHPVSVQLDNPKRISEIFDEISYRKGAVLIRMMTMFLGEDIFRKAINSYLVKYSYRNAAQDDLWRELTAVTQQYGVLSRNVTVKEIMDTWTTQTGYPLLTVQRDYTDASLTVSQKRYLALGARLRSTSSWWVPLNVVCENEIGKSQTEPIEWLSREEGTVSEHRFEHGSKPEEWVLFNADMIAPYRINYDERNWNLLIKTLNSDNYKNIPTLSRVQLVEDSMALAWTNVLDYTTTLKLISYLQNETEFLPLETGLAQLLKIDTLLQRDQDYGAFQKFMRKMITATYERVGGLHAKAILNGNDLISVKMQVITTRWACRMKVPGCEENAMELFTRWMNTENPDEDNPIPLDLRSTVYCVGISRGSVGHWRFLLARKQNTNVASVRSSILSALACTRETWILNQYLEWAVQDNSEVRRQDSALVIASVLRSPIGYYIAKEFIYNRIADICKAFHNQTRRLGGIIKFLLAQFTTQKDLDEFIAWQKANEKYFEDSQQGVQQAIERAKVNIEWAQRNKQHVVEQMREYSS